MASLIDAVFLAVRDVPRSIAFYKKALLPLGITYILDYDGKSAPFDHPNLYGFGRDGRIFFWLKQGTPGNTGGTHVGFAAKSKAEVDSCYEAATGDGATPNDSMGGPPGARTWYDSRGQYYAANVLDPDGYSLEFTYKSFQHPAPGTD